MTVAGYRIISMTLMVFAFSPMATAQIFVCDGPDGPIYTDRECGPDARNVEVSDSSGLSGVSDEIKVELAEKRAERQKLREENLQRERSRPVINNQYTTINNPPTGRWLYPSYWGSKPERPRPPVVKPTPLPSTVRMSRK